MPQTPSIDRAQVPAARAAEGTSQTAEQMKLLAAQFESVLLGQMMRQMRDSMFDEDDEQGKASGFSSGPLADQVYSELSVSLAQAGGIGLGKALGGALARQAEAMELGKHGAVGAMPADLTLPGGSVSSGYGWRRDPMSGSLQFHKGADIPMPVGHEVVAAQAGTVESVGEVPGYGLTVVIRHDKKLETRYGHLSEAAVKAGDVVTQGQMIAKSGSSGRSTGPHLHFEVIDRGQTIDPMKK